MAKLVALVSLIGVALGIVGIIRGRVGTIQGRPRFAAIASLSFLLLVMATVSGTGPPAPGIAPSAPAPSLAAAAVPSPAPALAAPVYAIASTRDVSVGGVKRYVLGLVVAAGSDQATIAAAVGDAVAKRAASERVNALAVNVYDRREDADGIYTLARVEWAPRGIWADASAVKAGDYSTHQFGNWQFRQKVSNPGSVTRPTGAQFVLHDAYRAAKTVSPDADETAVFARVAADRGVPAGEVRAAAQAWVTWANY